MTKIRLLPSGFGLNQVYDTLVVEAHRMDSVTPVLILTFVQAVLGYNIMDGKSDGRVWEFSRCTPIR